MIEWWGATTLWDVFFCAMITWLFYLVFLAHRRLDRMELANVSAELRRRKAVHVDGLVAGPSESMNTPSDFERERLRNVVEERCPVGNDPRSCSGCLAQSIEELQGKEVRGDSCGDCGESYAVVFRLPNDLWAKVAPDQASLGEHPEHQGGGLLCVACANARALALGVHLIFVAEEFYRPVSEEPRDDGNGGDTVSTAPQMRVLSPEECATMDPPYPPEVGYVKEAPQHATCDVCGKPYEPIDEELDTGLCGTCQMKDDVQRAMDRDKEDL